MSLMILSRYLFIYQLCLFDFLTLLTSSYSGLISPHCSASEDPLNSFDPARTRLKLGTRPSLPSGIILPVAFRDCNKVVPPRLYPQRTYSARKELKNTCLLRSVSFCES